MRSAEIVDIARGNFDIGDADCFCDLSKSAGRRIESLLALLRPCQDEALKIWPVDKMVGNVRNNGPQLILPVLNNAPAKNSRDETW